MCPDEKNHIPVSASIDVKINLEHQQGLDLGNRGQHAAACEKLRHVFVLLESIPAWASRPNMRFFYATVKNNMGNSLTAMGKVDDAVSAFDESLRLLDFVPEEERYIASYAARGLGPHVPADVAAVLQARPEEAVRLFRAAVYYDRGLARSADALPPEHGVERKPPRADDGQEQASEGDCGYLSPKGFMGSTRYAHSRALQGR
jgi:tetratricopeptide (TPR) repeat protein